MDEECETDILTSAKIVTQVQTMINLGCKSVSLADRKSVT